MKNVVVGVIDDSPGGAGNDDGWVLVLHLMPWVDAADRLGDMPLRVEIDMPERRITREMNRLERGMTVLVHTTGVERPATPPWHRVRGKSPVRVVKPSAVLLAAHAERERPVVIKDGVLGRLVLARQYNWFDGRALVWGRRCRVTVDRSSTTDDRAADLRDIKRATKRFAEVGAARVTIERAIADEMLDLYNDTWRGNRRILTRKELIARLRIESINLSTTRTTIYFKDGGLFYDHAIEVRITPRGRVAEVSLAG